MVFPLPWPAGLVPETESWTIENADLSGGMSITGFEQIVSAPAGRWKAALSFKLQREDVLDLRGLVFGLKGRAGTVMVGPFDLHGSPMAGADDGWAVDLALVETWQTTLPIQTPVEALTSEAAARRATSLSVKMAPGRRARVGNYIGIEGRLHVVTSAAVVSDTDQALTIEPPLRAAVGSGVPVTFTGAACPMRLASPVDSMTVTGGDHVTSVTLSFVEAP